MKKCTKYIMFVISLFLTLSLILDAFADDNRSRKRHRYRGGSQKVDDDNDDHDLNDYLKPVTNQTYKETCAECHFAYQPELLPSASWLKIVLFSCVFLSEFINQRLSFDVNSEPLV